MDDAKRERLEAAGWVEATVEEFLGLDEVDSRIVEFRVRVAREVRRRGAAAVGMGTDAILSAFFAAGGSLDDLAAVLRTAPDAPAPAGDEVVRDPTPGPMAAREAAETDETRTKEAVAAPK